MDTDPASPLPALTVEDVFIGLLPASLTQVVSAAHTVLIAKAWLTQHEVLRTRTADDFFAQPDAFGWAATPKLLSYWQGAVTAKFLKFAASEYAYFHLPSQEDTMWLTGETALLIKLDHVKTAVQRLLQQLTVADALLSRCSSVGVDTTAILYSLLFVLIYYERPAIAVRALEPVFLAILREQAENFTVVPQLLSYFLPHISFQTFQFADRIALLANQLVQRGFQFSAGFSIRSPDDAAPRVVVEVTPMKVDDVVLRVQKAAATATEVRIRSQIVHDNGDVDTDDGLSLSQYLSLVVRVCQQYFVRCRQAARKQRKNGAALLRLLPTDVMRLMRELHAILRFLGSYGDRFQQLGLWRTILTSEGWVPLQVIDEQLSNLPNSILKDLPSKEKRDIVESLLRQHDNFQRFELDFCPLESSDFYGQRCARSVYGHNIRNPPLYRNIICHTNRLVEPSDENAVARVPLYGWIALSGSPRKLFGKHPSLVALFDNIPFLVVMPAEAIGAFRDYDETTPPEKKYDEKLRRPTVHFAEIYLRALARDGEEALVLDNEGTPILSSSSKQQQRNGAAAAPATMTEVYTRAHAEEDSRKQRWYVFPQYYANNISNRAAPLVLSSDEDYDEQQQKVASANGNKAAVPKGAGREVQQYCQEGAVVHRFASRSGSCLGVPKLFFTGRLAQLRALGESDVSRRASAAPDSVANADGGPQLACCRGTPREFDAPTPEIGEDAGAAQLPPKPLCEYAIIVSAASPALLPPVVVHATLLDANGTDHSQHRDSEEVDPQEKANRAATPVVVCLSAHEPAAVLYRRCFPPSRMQSIFRDYLDDPLMPKEKVRRVDDASNAITAEIDTAAEWQRAASQDVNKANAGRHLGQWGVTCAVAPATPSLSLANSSYDALKTAPLREALLRFIASDQVMCQLEIRVADEAGLAIPGCRQAIKELQLFAKERALTYAKVNKASSQDRRAQEQQERHKERTSDAGLRNTDSPLVSPKSLQAPSSQSSGDAVGSVTGIEVIEFRKRITWSMRDLEHTLNELQLTARDVPYVTLITALTCECEDRSANYELLEFIGDAVMDFLVVADACLLSNAVYQQQRRRRAVADGATSGEAAELTLPPWTPESSRLPLPRHCWVSAMQPLSAVMTDNVTSILCRNNVIAQLLPPTVARHFSEERYPKLAAKVRADVFEALIGAAYRSGVGLDRVRLLLRRLFSFLPAAARTAAPSCAADLEAALQTCPYLIEEAALGVERLLSYRTNELLEMAPGLSAVGGDATAPTARGGRLVEKEDGVNTHLVSSGLPRIQAKNYATMFTTGSAYAYRRLFSFDTVRVHNRVLHLFSEHSIGFLNEIFTNTIHLVLDIDKVSLMSWGLLHILWAWYADRYRCPAGAFALDCSGWTMSSKGPKWKDSCHIHFPQVTVSVDTWDWLVADICDAVVTALTEKETRLQNVFNVHAADYCVWLRRSTLLQTVKASGGGARPHMWSYCDAASLFQLARTCRAVRLSVLEHIAYLTHTLAGMAEFADVDSATDVFVGDAKEELVVVEHRLSHHRLILPQHWIEPCRMHPPCPVFPPKETWDSVIDQGLAKSRKLRLYLNDKCDTIYGVEKRPLVLDALLLPPPPSAHDRDPVKFDLYRPQRFDRPPVETTDVFFLHRSRQDEVRLEARHAIYQMRNARLSSERHRSAEDQPGAVLSSTAAAAAAAAPPQMIQPMTWDMNEFGDDCQEGWVVECAHRSILTLSSLRNSEYRGTDARTYTPWVDCAPLNASSTADISNGKNDNDSTPLLLSQKGHCDLLPSFNDVYEHRVTLSEQPEGSQWELWLNFFKMRTRDYVMREDKTPTIRVWSPAWWAYDPVLLTATFYIATEPVLRLARMDSLSQALSPPAQPGGGAGLERVAQLFMPHLSTRGRAPVKVKGSSVYLLFPEKSGGAVSPPPNSTPPIQRVPASPVATHDETRKRATTTATTTTTTAGNATMFPAVSSPRDTFGVLPSAVSLARWINMEAEAMSAVAWLCRAVSFVFTATAARTEFGCVPLVLCDSTAVYQDLRVAEAPPAWLPFVLPLQDSSCVARFAQDVLDTPRIVLRHVFVVSSSVPKNKVDTTTLSRTSLTNIETLTKLLAASGKESTMARLTFYVSTDAQQRDLQRIFSPTAGVL